MFKWLFCLFSINTVLFAACESPLSKLIQERQARVIIEVGSRLEKLSIALAKELPSDGQIYVIDDWQNSPDLYEQFLSDIIQAGLSNKVIPLATDSLEAVGVFSAQPDLIYIDADPSTEIFYRNLTTWYPATQNKHTVLCGNSWNLLSVRKAILDFKRANNLDLKARSNFWQLITRD